jgi:hypothetical protein
MPFTTAALGIAGAGFIIAIGAALYQLDRCGNDRQRSENALNFAVGAAIGLLIVVLIL